MGYRKLTVDGKTYQYVIGKKFTKVKLPDDRKALIIENEKIGYKIAYQASGPFYDDVGKTFEDTGRRLVTPGSIAAYLKTGESPVVNKCRREDCGCVGMLVVNPFEAEIYGKTHFMNACARCHTMTALDI